MNRSLTSIGLLCTCCIISCDRSQMTSPNAGPVSTIRDDQYIYPFGKFYAPSSESLIELGFVDPVPNAPIIWVKGTPVDVTVDVTTESVVKRLVEPDSVNNDGNLQYRTNKNGAGVPTVEFRVKGKGFVTIVIKKGGGLSST